MAGRVFFSGLFPRANSSYTPFRFHLWGQVRYRLHFTSERVEVIANKSFKTMQDLNFEQFKKTRVKPFEVFRESPRIKELFGNHREKISKAYEDYCICKFNRYRLGQRGGNPGTMM